MASRWVPYFLSRFAGAATGRVLVATSSTEAEWQDPGAASVPDATTSAKGKVELATDGETAAGVVVQGNDSRLSDARTPSAHTHATSEVTGLDASLSAKATTASLSSHTGNTSNPHSVTAAQAGALATGTRGAASGVASLDGTTKIPIAEIPTGSTSTTVAIGNDARLSDARAPTAHASSHHSGGGADALAHQSITGSGTNTHAQIDTHVASTSNPHTTTAAQVGALATGTRGAASGVASLDGTTKIPIAEIPTGSSSTTVTIGNDARLSDARAPTAHASSHHSGGGTDPLAHQSITGSGTLTHAQIDTRLTGYAYKTTTVLAGASTYNVPANVRALVVEVVGGGGGGGGAAGTTSNAAAAGGGGAGAYAMDVLTSLASSYAYSVGGGGGGSAAGTGTGTAGTQSTWAAAITAPGGSGGASCATGTAVLLSVGGAGAAVATGGDVNSGGAPGSPGIRLSATVTVGGNGGSSTFGAGGNGVANNGAAAASATGFGAGGAGAAVQGAATRTGGAGTAGTILVHEYY
jgi:hypothetical protein